MLKGIIHRSYLLLIIPVTSVTAAFSMYMCKHNSTINAGYHSKDPSLLELLDFL